MRERQNGGLRLLLFALLMQLYYLVHSDEHALTVLYPTSVVDQDGELLQEVIEGILDASSDWHVTTYPTIEKDEASLRAFLRGQTPSQVITLGRSSYELYQRQRRPNDPEPVVGALDITRDTHPLAHGVGMDVAPEQLFVRLKVLAPEVTRVLVVYDPHRDTTTIRQAMVSASAHGLQFKGFQAVDASQSSRHFSNLFRYANPISDALWLPPDENLIRHDTHLPAIIGESWNRRFTVFSSNAEHAKHGVLFAVYPDPKAMGRALVEIASQHPYERDGLGTLSDVESSLDLRVVRHLGLELPDDASSVFSHIIRGNESL